MEAPYAFDQLLGMGWRGRGEEWGLLDGLKECCGLAWRREDACKSDTAGKEHRDNGCVCCAGNEMDQLGET